MSYSHITDYLGKQYARLNEFRYINVTQKLHSMKTPPGKTQRMSFDLLLRQKQIQCLNFFVCENSFHVAGNMQKIEKKPKMVGFEKVILPNSNL